MVQRATAHPEPHDTNAAAVSTVCIAADGAPRSHLTIAEVAALSGLAVNSVRNLIASGEIRAVRVGRSVRIPAGELTRIGRPIPNARTGKSA